MLTIRFSHLLIGLVMLLSGMLLQAQIDVISNYEGRSDLIKRNALVDEFIHRFNFDDLGTSASATERRTRILSLFDKNYLSKKESQLGDMIDKCVAKRKKASYYDTNWFARLKCRVNYKGATKTMDLFLAVETNYPSKECRWVLAGVNADFLDVDYNYSSPDQLIPPSNHEVGFSAVKRIFNDNANISAYAGNDYQPDYLSILFHEVKNYNLSVESVLDTQFYFTQVENWIFKIAFFNRKGNNSGWLISQAVKVRERNKKKYLYDKFHISY